MKKRSQSPLVLGNTAFRNKELGCAIELYEAALIQAEGVMKEHIRFNRDLALKHAGKAALAKIDLSVDSARRSSEKNATDAMKEIKRLGGIGRTQEVWQVEQKNILTLEVDECLSDASMTKETTREFSECMPIAIRTELADYIDYEIYINTNPDLKHKSDPTFDPRSHLIFLGLEEIYKGKRRLLKDQAYLSESCYLSQNLEVKQLVAKGVVSCGLEHYIRINMPMTEKVLAQKFNRLGLSFSLVILNMADNEQQSDLVKVLSNHNLKVVNISSLGAKGANALCELLADKRHEKQWIVIAQKGVTISPDSICEIVSNHSEGEKRCFYGGVRLNDGLTWFPGQAAPFDLYSARHWPAIVISPDAGSTICALYPGPLSKFILTKDIQKFVLDASGMDVEFASYDLKPLSKFASYSAEMEFYSNKSMLCAHIDYVPVNQKQKVSIIIPFKDKVELLQKCLDSLLSRTKYGDYEVVLVDNNSIEYETQQYLNGLESNPRVRVLTFNHPFNFSAINNFAAVNSDGDYLVLLNNDTEIISSDWLDKLIHFASMDDVGAVGALLTYDGHEIQHAGIAIGMNGLAGHPYSGMTVSQLKFNWKLQETHQVEAVTGACLAISRHKYMALGGLDQDNFAVAFNDIDLCLRCAEHSYINLLVPSVDIRHYESKTREWDCYDKTGRFAREVANFRKRHKAILERGERYLDINCSEAIKQKHGNIQGRSILILAIRLNMGFGVDLVIHNQASRLLAKGAKVSVAVHEYDRAYYSNVPYLVHQLEDLSAGNLLASIQSIIGAENVDVVIAHTTPFFEVLPYLDREIKTIAYEHGDPNPELFIHDRIEREEIKKRKCDNVYPAVDKVIAISHFISEDIDWPQAEIIYNGTDHLSTTIDKTGCLNFIARLGLDDPEKKIFLCVTRLGKGERVYKGLDEYAEFMKAYGNENAYYLVVGRGDSSDADELLAKGFRVLINASAEELQYAYQACDAFFSFSKWEGFNLPLVEAQSFGKPAFAIDRCSHREVTRNVFSSVVEMADAVAKLDKQGLAALGNESKSYIDRFTWATNADELSRAISALFVPTPMPTIVSGRTSICIVTKDKLEFIKPCIEALLPFCKDHDVEILVGDTGSRNKEVLSFYESKLSVVKLEYFNFYNFSKINNYLAKKATGDVIIFLNNDTLVRQANWLGELRQLLVNETVGIAGPLLVYQDENIQHAGIEIFLNEPYRYIGWHPYARRKQKDPIPIHEAYVVPAVTGACLAIKTELFRAVGGFDEVYREECQDVDLCLKAKLKGKHTVYTGKTSLYHFENGTRSVSERSEDREVFRGRWGVIIEYLFFKQPRQRLRFRRKIKLNWTSNNDSLLITELEKLVDCDITVCMQDGGQLPIALGESMIEVISNDCHDNKVYDEIINV